MELEQRQILALGRLDHLVERRVHEHAGDPARSKVGPIGLQLHDMTSIVMFRNIRMKEIGKP